LVLSSWTTVRLVSIPSTLVKTLTRIRISGVPEVIKDGVTKILENRGIKYSHRNDDILVPNTIEEQQMKKARKVRGHAELLVLDEQSSLSSRKGANAKRRPRSWRRSRSPKSSGHRKGSTINVRPAPEPSMFYTKISLSSC
jgi:hypothetical protein